MYIQLVSLHGLIRGENVEMGRDLDTGGQVRYVLDLAKTLSELPNVDGVDLFTRRIKDKRVSDDYSKSFEQLAPNCRLVRLPCGGGRYVRKERLWPFVDEYVDAMISFTRRESRTPTIVHGHYADGGYVAKEVAAAFDVPFVFTGHSLGKPKLDYLLEAGWTKEAANKEFAIDRRIAVEQDCLTLADLVVTSTRHERDTQYGKYHRDSELNFQVIPPGTDLERFFPYYEYDMPNASVAEHFKQARVRMNNELQRFLTHPEKKMIFALCRPERRKNVGALIKVYGESKHLQGIANLVVLAGIRSDIESMPDNERRVLTDMLLAMDRYDLYGKMAIPKNHESETDVPELYRIAAARRGVFVNSALTELFGLTAIEASAVGLPIVVTDNGGPQDIIENCQSGLLVDVTDQQALTSAMLKMLTDDRFWNTCSANGVNLVRKHYSWQAHCERYLECVEDIVATPTKTPSARDRSAPGPRLGELDAMLITDIDNTLLGDDEALDQLKEIMHANRDRMGFGVASGRALELVQEALDQNGIDEIDVIVAGAGSEIYYTSEHVLDKGWASRIRHKWKPDEVREALAPLEFIRLQEGPHTQREFKISYDLDEDVAPATALPQIHDALAKARLAYTLILSHGTLIDVLPHRASKGKAVRYVAGKWNIPLEDVVTAGDSGNDRDMLVGQTAGIVVGNYDEELRSLLRSKANRVYFAEAHCAGGIIEGLQHYGFISKDEPAAYEPTSNGSRYTVR